MQVTLFFQVNYKVTGTQYQNTMQKHLLSINISIKITFKCRRGYKNEEENGKQEDNYLDSSHRIQKKTYVCIYVVEISKLNF